jgi:hypothetical protein
VAKFYEHILVDSVLCILTSRLFPEPSGLSVVEQLLVVKLRFK